jgi:hypothetical protein
MLKNEKAKKDKKFARVFLFLALGKQTIYSVHSTKVTRHESKPLKVWPPIGQN